MHKQLSLELSLWTVKQFKEGSLEEARHSLGGKVYLLGMVGGGGEAALAGRHLQGPREDPCLTSFSLTTLKFLVTNDLQQANQSVCHLAPLSPSAAASRQCTFRLPLASLEPLHLEALQGPLTSSASPLSVLTPGPSIHLWLQLMPVARLAGQPT
jgi:hypothetical protein